MDVKINLRNLGYVEINRNIDALQKAIDKHPLSAADTVWLVDTMSILEGIKKIIKDRAIHYD